MREREAVTERVGGGAGGVVERACIVSFHLLAYLSVGSSGGGMLLLLLLLPALLLQMGVLYSTRSPPS